MNAGNSFAAVGAGLWAANAEYSADVQALLDAIKTYEFGQSRQHLTRARDWVVQNMADADSRRAIAHALTGLLASDATYQGKQFCCRQLALIAGPDNVPGIAPLLDNDETADMARYALETLDAPGVDDALIAACGEATGPRRVGLIATLGQRRTAAAVDLLADIAVSDDQSAAEAAFAALGHIGTPDAARKLTRIHARATGERPAAGDERVQLTACEHALMACAAQLEADGESAAAQRIRSALQDAAKADWFAERHPA